MNRGRPFEPGNKTGRGRPKGSRNKQTSLARQLLDQHSEAIMGKALTLALQGDTALLRMLLSLTLPRPKDPPGKIGPLPMGTAEELSQTFDAVLKKVSSGQITPSQSKEIIELIEIRRRLIETHELANRVSALEQSLPEKTKDPSPPF